MTRESLLNSTLFEFYAAAGISDNAHTEKVIGTSSYLLRELNNPYNIEVLTSNICAGPVIWSNPDVLFTSKKLLECYLVAAREVLKNSAEAKAAKDSDDGQLQAPRLHLHAWLTAVERGLGLQGGVPRKLGPQMGGWKASLVVAGIAYGLSIDTRKDSSPDLDPFVQPLVDRLSLFAVELANLVIAHQAEGPPVAVTACIIALAILPLQYIHIGLPIRAAFALPILEALLGNEGLRDGQAFVPTGDALPRANGLIDWPADSHGFSIWKNQWNRPLLSLISQLLWLEVEIVKHAPTAELGRFADAIDRILLFSDGVRTHWEQSVLAEVELTQPGRYLTPETLESSWKLLDSQLSKLSVVIVAPLKEILGRLLGHYRVCTPDLARKCLLVLRNTSFATQGRITASTFYTFALGASLDILATSPNHCNRVLEELSPPRHVPLSRMQRTQAIFFFHVAEGLSSHLPPGIDTALISAPAVFFTTRETGIYLNNKHVQTSGLELWESAHVAVLALIANTHLTPADIVEPYLNTLLSNYPLLINLSQLIVGFRTLVQVSSPPYLLSASCQDLPSVLMEMMHCRALRLPKTHAEQQEQQEEAGARTGCILAMIEALPFMPHDVLPEWLDAVYRLMMTTATTGSDQGQLYHMVDAAFSHALSMMDPTRSIICCNWWTTSRNRIKPRMADAVARADVAGVSYSATVHANDKSASVEVKDVSTSGALPQAGRL